MTKAEASGLAEANQKRRRAWAKQAARYDKAIGFFERRVFGKDHRAWACSQASGATLEVAIGTGLNLPYYPEGVSLTAIDLTPEMLRIARERAEVLAKTVDLRAGDAHNLEFASGSFDTVVCTYSLCNIPDPGRAVAEMHRVLSPGGKLILVDHVRSDNPLVYLLQKAIEFFSVRIDGDHMTRRPLTCVHAQGFDAVTSERHGRAGIVERVLAVKPASPGRV